MLEYTGYGTGIVPLYYILGNWNCHTLLHSYICKRGWQLPTLYIHLQQGEISVPHPVYLTHAKVGLRSSKRTRIFTAFDGKSSGPSIFLLLIVPICPFVGQSFKHCFVLGKKLDMYVLFNTEESSQMPFHPTVSETYRCRTIETTLLVSQVFCDIIVLLGEKLSQLHPATEYYVGA